MSSDNKPARWKVVVGYTVFSVFALVVCLFLTFPFDTLRARLATEAARNGLALRIGSLRPGFLGITARDVQVSHPPEPLSADAYAALTGEDDSALGMMGPAVFGEALVIDSVTVRPSLFPLGVSFNASALGGTLKGAVGGLKDVTVKLDAQGLRMDQGNLPAFSGVELEGTVGGRLTLTLPRGTGKDAELDLAAADGELALDTSGLVIRGGKVSVPMMPNTPPVPIDLPRIAVGELVGRLDFVKGLGTVKELRLKSEDLEAHAEGTLKLGKRVAYSAPALDLRVKAETAFVKRIGLLGAGLSLMAQDPKDPNFRVGQLTGFLNKPQFGQPRR
ncbi:type II secretion system protein GspN [Myxococcaceae bacterium GXIMD 01537]